MKLSNLTLVILSVAFSMVFISCNKIDIQHESQAYQLQIAGKSSYIMYIDYMKAVPEGGCLVWSYKHNDPFQWGYCSKYANTDVAVVYIKDSPDGAVVSGAKVTGNWTGGYTINGAMSTTNRAGIAYVNGLSGNSSSVRFTVTNVSLQGSTYNANLNVQNSVTFR